MIIRYVMPGDEPGREHVLSGANEHDIADLEAIRAEVTVLAISPPSEAQPDGPPGEPVTPVEVELSSPKLRLPTLEANADGDVGLIGTDRGPKVLLDGKRILDRSWMLTPRRAGRPSGSWRRGGAE